MINLHFTQEIHDFVIFHLARNINELLPSLEDIIYNIKTKPWLLSAGALFLYYVLANVLT